MQSQTSQQSQAMSPQRESGGQTALTIGLHRGTRTAKAVNRTIVCRMRSYIPSNFSITGEDSSCQFIRFGNLLTGFRKDYSTCGQAARVTRDFPTHAANRLASRYNDES